MPREIHDHRFSGRTTINDQHRHRFMGVTSENRDTPRHTHIMAGNTDFRQGHRHRFRIRTGPPIPYRNGHVHYFYGITTRNDGHVHLMFGYTRIHRNDDYGVQDDYNENDYFDNNYFENDYFENGYFGIEPEQSEIFEE